MTSFSSKRACDSGWVAEFQIRPLGRDTEISFPNERFGFRLTPSGSTEAIVIWNEGVLWAHVMALASLWSLS
nr:hypothetical protein [Tanacetum cinerariifolium]